MRTVAAIVFPNFELLDLFGPLQLFGMMHEDFTIKIWAQNAGPVASSQGPAIVADGAFGDEEPQDIILLPGGRGTRVQVENEALLGAIARHCGAAELALSVCTGSALLARAGVLAGKRATTNKSAFNWVAAQGPKVNWVPRARWAEDGRLFTSSGVSAGMDMTLAVIATLHGIAQAEQIARWAEYAWQRDSEQDAFADFYGLAGT